MLIPRRKTRCVNTGTVSYEGQIIANEICCFGLGLARNKSVKQFTHGQTSSLSDFTFSIPGRRLNAGILNQGLFPYFDARLEKGPGIFFNFRQKALMVTLFFCELANTCFFFLLFLLPLYGVILVMRHAVSRILAII